jgi:hypothetical protein
MWVVPRHNPPRPGGLADPPPPVKATITRKASRAPKEAIITGKAYRPHQGGQDTHHPFQPVPYICSITYYQKPEKTRKRKENERKK